MFQVQSEIENFFIDTTTSNILFFNKILVKKILKYYFNITR